MALELVLAASIITPSRGVEVLCIWISTTFGDGKFHLLGCFASHQRPLESRELTIESSTLNGVLISIPKGSLTQVLVSQLDSLHILLFLHKHVSILEELL